jgi:Ca2+-binding EF-hand superfamily protein
MSGVSRAMALRLKHDAMMSPSVLALRVNRQNIVNEMRQHNGKAFATKLVLKKPRRRTQGKLVHMAQTAMLDPLSPTKASNNFLQQRVGMACLLDAAAIKRLREEKEKKETADKAEAAALVITIEETSALRKQQQFTRWLGTEAEVDLNAIFKLPEGRDRESTESELELAKQLDDPHFGMVYRSLQQDDGSGLPRARVHRTLEALGFVSPDPVMMQETLRGLGKSDILSMTDFAKVVVAQRLAQREKLRRRFEALDTQHVGTIHSRELRPVLRDLGFAITPDTMEELLREVGVRSSDKMMFDHFDAALQVVRDRYGFTKDEVEVFHKLFDRYDFDKSGDMSADELSSAMGWLGMPTPISQAQSAIVRFDLDGNSRLCRPEFLLAVRWWRDEEVEATRQLFAKHDGDRDGNLDVDECRELLSNLGYTISKDVIEECMFKVKAHSKGLFFEEILQLLQVVRSQEGFSDLEAREINDIFTRFDRKGNGQLRPFELTRVLNWLGYPISQHRREQLWCRVDVDKSGFLEPTELLKLIRILREEENAAGKKLLENHFRYDALKSHIRQEDLKNMLVSLGYAPPASVLAEAAKLSLDSNGDGRPDLAAILAILNMVRERQVAKLRRNAGLSEHKVEKIQSKFGRRLEVGRPIEPQELEKLMFNLFPGSGHIEEERSRLKILIADYHEQHCIKSFDDVFWIVRVWTEIYEENLWQREADVVAETLFSPAEVAQFREAFVDCDADGSGALSETEISSAFDEVVAFDILQVSQLQQEIKKIKKGRNPEEDKPKLFDFPEFLRFAKRALDSGWLAGTV